MAEQLLVEFRHISVLSLTVVASELPGVCT